MREWIPVSERLPAEYDSVLVWNVGDVDGGICLEACMVNVIPDKPIWSTLTDRVLENVTHWMPMPDGPT